MISGKVKVSTAGIAFLVAENKRRDVTLKGVRAAAKVLERAAKAEAPRRTGMLRKAQGVLAKKGRKGTTTSFAVQGAKKRTEKMVAPPGRKKAVRVVPAFYDHLVQGGTKPHSVSKGERLGREKQTNSKGRIFGRQVAQTSQTGKPHPGARPNPYRKRAWSASQGSAGEAGLVAMAEAERKLIAQAAAKSLSVR